MAHESATADFSELQTSSECSGCGKELNLLKSHVLLTVKAQRQVIETVDAALVGAEVNDKGEIVALAEVPDGEDTDTARYYMGTRSGATEHVVVHNSDCAIEFLKKQKALKDTPRVKLLQDEPEAEGRSNE